VQAVTGTGQESDAGERVKVSQWVDFGQEVEVEICVEDIRIAMQEDLDRSAADPLGEAESRFDFKRALSSIHAFVKGIRPGQIETLSPAARKTVASGFRELADRMEKLTEVPDAVSNNA
jgi:hypothetical protein